ncbi:MAG TPA: NINE protein [Magnetospirillum sp.]|nr:NINE protein [Magnetospirillum sp.]
MTTEDQPGTFRFTGDYHAAVATMARAMTETGGTIKKQQPENGVVEGTWRYGINPWGLCVTGQFRDEGGGTTAVTVRGGFKDAFSTVKAPREKAAQVMARFVELMGQQPSVSRGAGACAPRLGDCITPHRGKSKTTAALLALLLGGFGVHRFYLGTWGVGLLYLALLLVPGLGLLPALAETIRLFAMSEPAFDDRYNLRQVGAFHL